MNAITSKLQREAERIASHHPLPEFYARYRAPLALARRLYYHHPLVLRLREIVEPELQEDLGHGITHCMRVSLDGATLVFIERDAVRAEKEATERLMLLALLAGLLHDIRRGEERHAEAGAAAAAAILRAFPLSEVEVESICQAIRNHEAFLPQEPIERAASQLLSDCLYDADKFRWGPDTFTHTLWHMVDHQGLSPEELIARFPWGMSGIDRIQGTFRSATGRQFGPEIIETGIAIGKEIYRYLLAHFGGDAHGQ